MKTAPLGLLRQVLNFPPTGFLRRRKLIWAAGWVGLSVLAGVAWAGSQRPAGPPELEPLRTPFWFGQPKPDRHFAGIEALHADHFQLFQSTPGFGMSRVIVMPTGSELDLFTQTYFVPKPDLLALETGTVAYRSPGQMLGQADLTNRQMRARLQTRELSAAEQRAVAELRAGKDLVLAPARFPVVTPQGTNEVSGLLAVGALRATTACVQCHGVAQGALLGAFSYALMPRTTSRPALAGRVPVQTPGD